MRAIALGRIVGEEMHARDERVGGQHEIVAQRGLEKRGVVAKPEAGGTGERREKARNEFVFAGSGRHEAKGLLIIAGRRPVC